MLSIGGFLVISSGSVFAFNQAYSEKIFPGVYLVNENISGMDRSGVKNVIKEKKDSYQNNNIIISWKDKKWTPNLEYLGIIIDEEKTADQLLNRGRGNGFFANIYNQLKFLFSPEKVPVTLSVNEEKINKYLDEIGKSVNKPATNATLAIKDTKTIELISEKEGEVLNKELMREKIVDEVSFFKVSTIDLSFKKQIPEVKSDEVEKAKEQAFLYISSPITLKYNDQTFTLPPELIASWIDFLAVKEEKIKGQDVISSDNKVLGAFLSDERVSNYLLSEIASQIDRQPKNTKITHTSGQRFVIEQGYDGLTLDVPAAINQIKNLVVQQNVPNKEAVLTVQVAKSQDVEVSSQGIAPAFNQGQYIDISLSRQLLTCFQDGKAVFSSSICSGMSGFATPTGTFKVNSKVTSTRMKGYYGPGNPNNYDLPNVPWVVYFTGAGHAIHGAYWRSTFGYPASHGCVNLPVSASNWVYNWTPIGTTVYVYY